MKGNLMDSIVSLASIAKRYDLSIQICTDGIYLVKNKKWDCKFIDVKDPKFLSKDFDDVCRCFKEEKNESEESV